MRKNNERKYIGHLSQVERIEEHVLKGGKGDGMRLLEVNNGNGLQFTVSLDRCADLSRLSFKGVNFGYFTPCGYVAPSYYDAEGFGFLKSFTAGFMTTCGFNNVGGPCEADGEKLPQHGTISNTPAENVSYWTDEKGQHIIADIRQAQLFGNQYLLRRKIDCPKGENYIDITDTIVNESARPAPMMLLYHCNIGYPLLTEDAELYIPSAKCEPSGEWAAKNVDTWNKVLPPQEGFEEQCYFHKVKDEKRKSFGAIFNPEEGMGVAIEFDTTELDCLTEWKMMGEIEYVMGIEPGNSYPIGRAKAKENNTLKMLASGEEKTVKLRVRIIENEEQANAYKSKIN
ncbi:MAG: aldose 1-epimerase family protein [Clostridia bacterium]|nr:aldose 1-epimerase family protein [Clostridia bacterium]